MIITLSLILWFWPVCFAVSWECCNFPGQTLTLRFRVTEKTPPFIANYCFSQIHGILVRFSLKDQNKCEACAFSIRHSDRGSDLYRLTCVQVVLQNMGFTLEGLHFASARHFGVITALGFFVSTEAADVWLGQTSVSSPPWSIFRVTLLLLLLFHFDHISFYVFTCYMKMWLHIILDVNSLLQMMLNST